MTRSLKESLFRGRRVLFSARQRGIDTVQRETVLTDIERQLSPGGIEDAGSWPLQYLEALLRPVVTTRVLWYVEQYLETIERAWIYQEEPKRCWGMWTPQWWKELGQEAWGSLTAVRDALVQRERSADA